jgi:hypothetical protein
MNFIRKGGKVIPIGALRGGVFAKKTISAGIRSSGLAIKRPETNIKPKQGLRALGFGLSVASGIVGAATVSGGAKKLLTGLAVSTGLDIASSTANVAAYTGKGNGKERFKLAAKQEGINQSVGWGIYGAGLLASKKNRQAIGGGIKTFGMKASSLIRRVKWV